MNCKNCKADCASKGIGCAKDCKGYIPKTNADCIRSMTDEELAKYIAWLVDKQTCSPEWLIWLKDEVKT